MAEFDPTPEQQAIIGHFEGHALVVAGPGSGKTIALVAHITQLVQRRAVSPDDIWIMAFNRDISAKLREKIQSELKEQAPQTTTIHAFILKQTLRHGAQLLGGSQIGDGLGECGTKHLLWRPITKRLKEKHHIKMTSEGKRLDIRHVENQLWNQLKDYWLTTRKPNDELFDKFEFEVERSKAIYKIVFLDELAIKFLNAMKANPSFRQDVARPRIIIDEFQDLNPTEHAILQQFREEGTTFAVFGDDDQAVNDFRRAHADYIRDFETTYKPKQYPLKRDRRCPKEILALADTFVRGLPRLPKPAGCAPHRGRVDVVGFVTDEAEKLGVGNIVEKYVSLSPTCDERQNPQVLVLSGTMAKVPGQSRISEIIEVLHGADIHNVTGEARENPFDNEWGLAFTTLVKMLADGFTPLDLAAWLSVTDPSLMSTVSEYLEAEERKGNCHDFLEAVLDLRATNLQIAHLLLEIEGLRAEVGDEHFDPGPLMRLIPAHLQGKDEVQPLVDKLWEQFRDADVVDADGSRDETTQSSKGQRLLRWLTRYVDEDIRRPEVGRVHVTTYRKAKGLEADLVVVTSVDSLDFSQHEEQKRRLLYVSVTRSKKNLVLTYADKRTGSRRYARGRPKEFEGIPRVYRSPMIPSTYQTRPYSEEWLDNWRPLL